MEQQEKYRSFLLQAGYWAAIALLVLLFVKYLLDPLSPFIIAFVVSMILQPLVKRLSVKLKVKSSIMAIILVLLTYLLLVGLVAGILIGLASALMRWAGGLPDYFSGYIYPWIETKGTELGDMLIRLRPELRATVSNMLPDVVGTISSFVMDFSKNVVSWASSVGTRLPGAFLTAVICVISTTFLAADYDNVVSSLAKRLPEHFVSVLRSGKRALGSILGNYARSYSLIFLITFAQMAVGLMIMGYEYALLYALGVAIFDIMPIVGSGMVLVPWIIITFIQGSVGRGIGLTILWLLVVISRQIIEPKIVGKQVGLHPLTTLVSMWLGLKLFGGVGLFALPIGLLIVMELKEEGLIGKKEETQALPEDTDSV